MAKKAVKKTTKVTLNEELYNEDGEKLTLVTKEGFEKLKEEYNFLTTTKKREVAERLKEAISYGDLSENSEYEEAKNEQAFVEGRIMELEKMIKNAKIISDQAGSTKSVQLGTTVYLENLTKKKDEKEVYTIVGSTEANPFENKISNESPIGGALLDKESGEEVTVNTPSGVVKYKIVKIS